MGCVGVPGVCLTDFQLIVGGGEIVQLVECLRKNEAWTWDL